jgi:hypothetical protein
MKTVAWLSALLGIGAVLEFLAGLGLLAIPSLLVSLLLGPSLTETGLVVARLGGGGLLALGIACGFARPTPISPVSLGVAAGLLVYNIVACIALASAQPMSTHRTLLLGASALHGVLAVGLLAALVVWRRQKSAAGFSTN